MKVLQQFEDYKRQIIEALDSIEDDQYESALALLEMFYKDKVQVFVFGNGGSAAIAEHFSCDHNKAINQDTPLQSNITCLSSNLSLISAIANDYDYSEVFSQQLSYHKNGSGLVIAISSSGNSSNIIKGLIKARNKGYTTIALVGFNGGVVMSEKLADVVIHVNSNNYGVVEDTHQMIMHSMAQSIRLNNSINPAILKL